MVQWFRLAGILMFGMFSLAGYAANKEGKSIEDILGLKEEPAGVVIEIVTWGGDNLAWALPLAKSHVDKLKKRYPDIQLAIVTHGAEQFGLTRDNAGEKPKVHDLVKSLGKENVPVHVCGTFAGWRGLTDEDFPDYVDVTAAGPATVNDYIAMGYELIVIKSGDKPE